MAVKYLRLFPAVNQFQTKNGAINTSGRIFVRLEGTDDFADLYDENGVQLSQPVVLDNNGRARGLFVDSAKVYWIDVQDQYGESLFTVRKMTPCGGGGGSVLSGTYDVVSSDGSITVDKSVDSGNTTFDLTRPADSSELLEWIRCDGGAKLQCSDTYLPLYTDGTMEVGNRGIKLFAGRYYHVTAHVRATKNVNREPWYDSINIMFIADYGSSQEVTVTNKAEIVDYSLGLSQEYEASTDIIPENDCELLIDIASQDVTTGGSFELRDVEVHRVYSGTPQIPSGVLSRDDAAEIYQPLLTAGDNIYIDTTTWTISAAGGGTQSDWWVNDTQSMAFIRHKPDLSVYATQSQVSALTAQLATLSNTVEQLSTAVSTLQTQMAYWIGQMNTLSGQVSTNTSNLSSLASRYAAHGNNYDASSHRIQHNI